MKPQGIDIVNVPKIMQDAAAKMQRGDLLIVYRDGRSIRCEM